MDGLNEDTQEVGTEEDTSPAGFDPAECVLADYQESKDYLADWHEKMQEEVEMVLDLQQYDTDLGHEKNSNFSQAKDMSLLSTCRRKWSQIGAAPIYINAFAQDNLSDPDAAERVRWALEREVYSSRKMFRRHRKRAIIGAVVGRQWFLTFGWNPKLEEITYGTLPSTDVFTCPGYQDVHDPECPYLILRFRVPVAAIRERARFYGRLDEDEIAAICPDSGSDASAKPTGPLPGMIRLDRSNPEGAPATPRQGTAVLLVAMYRDDPECAELEETLGEDSLPADKQFMRCWNCGHETSDVPRGTDGSLPEVGPQCPECLKKAGESVDSLMVPPMERVDTMEQYRTMDRFPNGRWIEVLEESQTCIYDGDWPYKKPDGTTLRSFPVGQYRIYDDPRNDIPHSDVSWQFNQQLLATFMLQWGIDQMRTSGRVIMFPKGALTDSRGRPYTPNNRLDNIAWVRDPMLLNAIKEFQPRGLPDGWGELYSALTNSYRSNLGTGELGLGPDQSKNLPVGTAHAIIESGDIPVDDAISYVRDEDGNVLGIVADMIQCCWTRAKWVRRLGEEGNAAFEYFSGADLCDTDVMVTGDPAMDVADSAKLDRLKVFFAMTPPEQELASELLHLDPSRIRKFQSAQARWQDAMRMGGGPVPGPVGRGGAVRPAPPPPRALAMPARTDLAAPGLDSLSPDLQAGLASLVKP